MIDYQKIYEELSELSVNWKNETEVRKDWLHVLENHLKVKFEAERDRNDASRNQIIIEFKNKGLFKGKASSAKFKEAIYDRLEPYILTKSQLTGIEASEYTGIATDGAHIVFAYIKGQEIHPQELMPFSAQAIEKVCHAIQNDDRRAVTADNLIEDFGHNSPVGRDVMGILIIELATHIANPSNNKIKMLFEEWRTLFGQVANLSQAQITEIRRTIRFEIPSLGDNTIPALLFVIHTYNALIMKLLGAEIASHFKRLTLYEDFCEYTACIDNNDSFYDRLHEDIERSQLFDNVGIKGFIEEAIFSWYLDVTEAKDSLASALRKLLIKMSLYRMDILTPARTQDVLKAFYQTLVPDTLRKSLGEFYTPDWLVDYTLDASDIVDWEPIKALDPTCGSGSFLLQIITRKRSFMEAKNTNPATIIDNLIKTVWGFDLNPLAVQAARVNFLIAIADLYEQCGALEIEIPILLADSIYSPARSPKSDEDTVEYQIGSNIANLIIQLPSILAFNRPLLDKVFQVMEECIENNFEYDQVKARLIKKSLASIPDLNTWEKDLSTTYNRILELHRLNWNGIWLRIVRNFFWSATAGEFDLVIGNPPWVRWSSLPELYRERIKPTCKEYKVFSDSPYHGGNELDISGMITYTTADKWLKENGKLVFVITQTHFQAPSSQGFRSFTINEEYRLVPKHVDDLKELKPFADAANKTAIVQFQKQKDSVITYPLPYTVWTNQKGYTKTLPETLSKKEILKRVIRKQMEANPVGDSRSPWAIMSPGQFYKTNKIRSSTSYYQGRKGVTADLNGIYIVRILETDPKNHLVKIQTRPEAGKTNIGKAESFWVEPDRLYPVVKGASDFSSCYFAPKEELYIFVPNLGIRKENLEEMENFVSSKLLKTEKYFKRFERLLLARSTYKARLSKYAYYAIYNVGTYTFAPYKVIWAEQSGSFKAAVVSNKRTPVMGDKPYVPDHKIYFVECNEKVEAYYLCGLLSCNLIKEYIESHTISIQVSNIFKHLHLPTFDANDPKKIYLAEKTEQAHLTSDEKTRENLLKEINNLADEIISLL